MGLKYRWMTILILALVTIAIFFSVLCILPDLRPSWEKKCHTLRVRYFNTHFCVRTNCEEALPNLDIAKPIVQQKYGIDVKLCISGGTAAFEYDKLAMQK
jgi:hypothetical protein